MEARLWADGKTISYRYHPVGGKPVNLGTDKQQAILKVAQMNGEAKDSGTVSDLWRIYQDSTAWKSLTERTQKDYKEYAVHLLRVFGDVHISIIRPAHIARYLRIERSDAPVRANREKALLSNLMQLAIEHGLIDYNVCKEVKRNPEAPRETVPEPETLERFLKWLSNQTPQRQIIALAAEYASLAGNRQIEFLDLTWLQVDEKVGLIRLSRAKQRHNKKVIELIAITPRMSDLLNRLKQLNRDCMFLFPNAKNNKYTSGSFKAVWQECIKSAIQAGVLNK